MPGEVLPAELRLSAWLPGEGPALGAPGPLARAWGLRRDAAPLAGSLAPPAAVPLTEWRDPSVGWGLVLPHPPEGAFTAAQLAAAADAPEPLRDLVADRSAPVLRHVAGGTPHLRRYFPDGSKQDVGYLTETHGTAKGALPFYLLLAAGPEAIPWGVQYALGRLRAVGRLALEGEALARYVGALLDDWKDDAPDATRAVVWSTDHGVTDITHLMAAVVAAPIHAALAGDDEIGAAGALALAAGAATGPALAAALAAHSPALVVTSSHGQTGPLDDAPAMAAALGLPIDDLGQAVTAAQLGAGWSPGGAIWYAQACCSAGATAASGFTDLLGADTSAHRVVAAVAALGERVAPLPTALLGASRPLRAWVGHVEPTFDWTLRDTENGQPLTKALVDAFYPRLFRREPLGLALRDFRAGGSALHGLHDDAIQAVNDMVPGAAERAVRYRLMARDRGSLVILGDPTVRVPPLPSQAGGG